MTPAGRMWNDHLTIEDLAAYLDGEIEPKQRARIQLHLEDCASCREEAADLTRILRRGNRRKVRRVAVPLAAAAAVVGILFVGPSLREGGEMPGERLRGPDMTSELEAELEIKVVTPLSQAVVESVSPEFDWEGAGEDAVYRFTLTDQSGGPIWSHETLETSVLLPSEIELHPWETYFWFVDVLLPDGRTGTTGVVEFTVRQ